MKKVIAIAIIIIALVGAATFALQDKDEPNDTSTNNTASDSSGTETDTETNQEAAAPEEMGDTVTIIYTDAGFSPQSYSINAGGTVTVRNDSDETLDFASDDHPAHEDNVELNAGDIMPGQSKSFSLDRTGEWGFHNHDDASHTGSISVK